MRKGSTLTAERLREVLSYCPITGVFRWRVTLDQRALEGQVAGYVKEMLAGRLVYIIGLDKVQYYASHLAWLYVLGTWPAQEVDHRNGDTLDQTWTNLRDVSKMVNLQNVRRCRRTKKYTDLLGAFYSKQHGRWIAKISANRVVHYLGIYDTAEEAHQHYLTAKRRLHEGNTL